MTKEEQQQQQDASSKNVQKAKFNLRRLATCETELEKLREFVEQFDTTTDTVFDLKVRKNSLQELKSTFASSFDKYLDAIDEETISKELLTRNSDFNSNYHSILAAYETWLESLDDKKIVTKPENPTLSYNPLIKLPEFQIPKFDGNYSNWLSFKETFKSVIIPADYPPVVKIELLKNNLAANLRNFLTGIEPTDAGFESAWTQLCERFDNNRIIVESHVKEIFNIKSVAKESSSDLRSLVDIVSVHLRSLKILQQPIEQWSTLLVHIITSKLDSESLKQWHQRLKYNELGSWEKLIDFLHCRVRTLESIETSKQSSQSTSAASQNSSKFPSKTSSSGFAAKSAKYLSSSKSFVSSKALCQLCSSVEHKLKDCDSFKNLNSKQKYDKIEEFKLCRNCFGTHFLRKCESKNVCRVCRQSHHSLLHDYYMQPGTSTSSATSSATSASTSKPSENSISKSSDSNPFEKVLKSNEPKSELIPIPLKSNSFTITVPIHGHVLFATALIHVIDAKGNLQVARALLDSASERNFISDSFRDLLGIKRQKYNHIVSGINSTSTTISGKITATIKSRYTEFSQDISLLCVPFVTSNQPSQNINVTEWHIPQEVELADPQFFKKAKIDILLGTGIFFKILGSKEISLGNNLPILRETKLGYIIGGDIQEGTSSSVSSQSFVITNEDLSNQLKLFWEIENCTTRPAYSKEQQECEVHFESTFHRNTDGRYVVKIPFRNNDLMHLGDSYNIALKRFLRLEEKLRKNPQVKQQYDQFMAEYLKLGHMEILENFNPNLPHYFVPHHAIEKPDSTTTKLRVVFDFSCPTSTGYALNDLILVGPPLQQDLIDIVLRNRLFMYALSGDIEKMFRQVWIHEDYQLFQLIIYRDPISNELIIIKLKTVTYGNAAAPYQSTKVIDVLVQDESMNFPAAAKSKKDIFVDNVFTGSNDVGEMIELRRQLTQMFATAGMKLRKWSSNHPDILQDILPEDLESTTTLENSACNEVIKTLGILWDPNHDNFHFKLKDIDTSFTTITKRLALSMISSLFDPLGILSPLIINAKIFMQKLWLLKMQWDENLPEEFTTEFRSILEDLKRIIELKVPRSVVCENYQSIELHGFSDSSILAYGAIVFIRCMTPNQTFQSRMYWSKSRVAPLKKFTLARLELCAAVLLAEMVSRIVRITDIEFNNITLWTDSTITLSWIQTQPNLLKTFESHRVANIHHLVGNVQWNHIRSKLNPADLITRGLPYEAFANNELWWKGPEFLERPNEEWPIPSPSVSLSIFTEDNLYWLFEHVSSWKVLINSVGYWLRAVENMTQEPANRKYGFLAIDEFNRARKCVIKLAQSQMFHEEIKCLKKGKELKRSSNLCQLVPFLNSAGIMCISGRLRNAFVSESAKHPIIISNTHPSARAIMRDFHERHHHVGVQTLLYFVRQEFWIIRGKQLAKKVVKDCVTCFRNKPKPVEQIMADLPADRVSPNAPFTVCGLDYCGPFTLRNKHQRKSPRFKAYILVIVCFSTKAIHLEVVSDLRTESFFQALSRFIDHHGKPSIIHCDNAKTYVGANNELRQFQEFLTQNSDVIIASLVQDFIQFKFIPSRAPHHGGIWESAVKSVKHHLKRISNDQVFYFEELLTICYDIEACLNSRPLTPLSDDPNDFSPLTPSHFTIGRPMIALNRPSYIDTRISLLSRWQYIQRLVQSFWQAWSKEYLNTLQIRKKWTQTKPDLKLNDIVLIHDDNLPPTRWMMGRIINIYPGKDGHVRVCTLRTATGKLKRPIVKVFPFPFCR